MLVIATALAVAIAACGGGADSGDKRASGVAAATSGGSIDLTCAPGAAARAAPTGPRDVVAGPVAFVAARTHRARPPDAFGGHGYKIPITLSGGQRATVTVPPRWHGKVGLVFTAAAQGRAWKEGVGGSSRSVRFTACAAPERGARSGWPGGFVVDRPRCPTLAVRVAGRRGVLRVRLALGRSCPAPQRHGGELPG